MKLFKKTKEIRSKDGILHFERFAIFETSLFSLYLHTIFKQDEDKHLHSHPWNFITVVLRGAYIAKDPNRLSIKGPGTFSFMTRSGFHKIDQIITGPVKTLFLTWGRHKSWYYLVNNNKVESNLYRKMKHTTGFKK